MNDEQYKRYRKMTSEPINCLLIKHDNKKNIYYLISGSSGIHYKVAIRSDGSIDCSCPDFKNSSKAQECICKHCLYVLNKVLKLFNDVDHTFYKRLFFTPDEIHTIHNIYREYLRTKKLN